MPVLLLKISPDCVADEIAQEADFYGSMDGASKFVRGDAIAGILIMLINIIRRVDHWLDPTPYDANSCRAQLYFINHRVTV